MIKRSDMLVVAWSHIQQKKQGNEKSRGEGLIGQNSKKGGK